MFSPCDSKSQEYDSNCGPKQIFKYQFGPLGLFNFHLLCKPSYDLAEVTHAEIIPDVSRWYGLGVKRTPTGTLFRISSQGNQIVRLMLSTSSGGLYGAVNTILIATDDADNLLQAIRPHIIQAALINQ